MKYDKTQSQGVMLEGGGFVLLTDNMLIVRAEAIQDFSLDIIDPRTRLEVIRWLGRLLDVMHAKLRDKPIRQTLVGAADIPVVVIALGTAWAHLSWLGGRLSLTCADVENLLAALGVEKPSHGWRWHCRDQAKTWGIVLETGFLV